MPVRSGWWRCQVEWVVLVSTDPAWEMHEIPLARRQVMAVLDLPVRDFGRDASIEIVVR